MGRDGVYYGSLLATKPSGLAPFLLLCQFQRLTILSVHPSPIVQTFLHASKKAPKNLFMTTLKLPLAASLA